LLCSLSLSLWSLLRGELAHYRTTTTLLPSLQSSLCFSEFFSGFGLGVLLRGRLGGANGCPSLRLG